MRLVLLLSLVLFISAVSPSAFLGDTSPYAAATEPPPRCDLLHIDATSTVNYKPDFVGKYPVIISGALSVISTDIIADKRDACTSTSAGTRTTTFCGNDLESVCASSDDRQTATSSNNKACHSSSSSTGWLDVDQFRTIFDSKSAKTSSGSSIVYSNGRAINNINIGTLLGLYSNADFSNGGSTLKISSSSSSSNNSSNSHNSSNNESINNNMNSVNNTMEHFVFDLDILRCSGTNESSGKETVECPAQSYFPIPSILLDTIFSDLLLQSGDNGGATRFSTSSDDMADLRNELIERKLYEFMAPVLSIGGIDSGLPFHVHGDAWLGLLPDPKPTEKLKSSSGNTYTREGNRSRSSNGGKLWMIYPPGYDVDSNRRKAGISADARTVSSAVATAALNPYMPVKDWIKQVYPEISLVSHEYQFSSATTDDDPLAPSACKLSSEEFLGFSSGKSSSNRSGESESLLLCGSDGSSAHQSSVSPFTCVQRPGEIMYVPAGWAHMTLNINIDETVKEKKTETKNETKAGTNDNGTKEFLMEHNTGIDGTGIRATVGVGGQAVWLARDRMKMYRPMLAKDPQNHDALKGMAVAIRAIGREQKKTSSSSSASSSSSSASSSSSSSLSAQHQDRELKALLQAVHYVR